MFYGIIATNTVNGSPFSFDGGVSRTTGFHWGGLIGPGAVAAVRRMLSGPFSYREFHHNLFTFDVLATSGVAFALVWRVRQRIRSPWITAALTGALCQTLLLGFGMETTVAALCLTLFLIEASADARLGLLFGFGAALAPARLDLVPAAAALGLIGIVLGNGRRRFQAVIVAESGLIFGVVLVFVANALVAGEPLSTSFFIKGSHARMSVSDLGAALATKWPFVIGFASMISFGLLTRRSAGTNAAHESSETRQGLVLPVAGALLLMQTAVQRSLGGNNLGSWYDVSWMTLFFLSGALLAQDIVDRRDRWRVPALACVALAIAVLIPREAVRMRLHLETEAANEYYSSLEEFGARLQALVSPDARIGVDDIPGRLTYFARRHVVALDGLVNDPEYARRWLLTGRVAEYVESHLDYVVLLVDDAHLRMLEAKLHDGATELVLPIGFLKKTTIPASQCRFEAGDIALRSLCRGSWAELWLVKVRRTLLGAE